MKNKLLLIVLFCTTAFCYAQRKENRDKIKSLKVAFITEHLALSAKEAQQFWPVYNDYEDKREALRRKERTQIRNKIRDAADLTEKEAALLLTQYLSFEEEEEELDRSFLKEISKVISAKKTLLLLRSEEEFKRQLIKHYRHNKGGGGYR